MKLFILSHFHDLFNQLLSLELGYNYNMQAIIFQIQCYKYILLIFFFFGGGGRGPNVDLRNGNVPCRYFLYFPVDLKIIHNICHLSISFLSFLKNINVPFLYFWIFPVDFKSSMSPSNFRKGCVNLSNLRVKGPIYNHLCRLYWFWFMHVNFSYR